MENEDILPQVYDEAQRNGNRISDARVIEILNERRGRNVQQIVTGKRGGGLLADAPPGKRLTVRGPATQPCMYFVSTGGCRHGASCQYSHEFPPPSGHAGPPAPPGPPQPQGDYGRFATPPSYTMHASPHQPPPHQGGYVPPPPGRGSYGVPPPGPVGGMRRGPPGPPGPPMGPPMGHPMGPSMGRPMGAPPQMGPPPPMGSRRHGPIPGRGVGYMR
jgi:hypothetical protein